jgi:hypothetical protein
MTDVKAFQKNWRKNLDELPATPEKIPSFFFGHGSPMLANDRDLFGGGIFEYAQNPALSCKVGTHNFSTDGLVLRVLWLHS